MMLSQKRRTVCAYCKSYLVLHQRIMFVSRVFIGAQEGPHLHETCDNTTAVIRLENCGQGVRRQIQGKWKTQ